MLTWRSFPAFNFYLAVGYVSHSLMLIDALPELSLSGGLEGITDYGNP